LAFLADSRLRSGRGQARPHRCGARLEGHTSSAPASAALYLLPALLLLLLLLLLQNLL
jgi:hypothetical protein